jgi:CRISPR-associated endonuclease/helicase Cas3
MHQLANSIIIFDEIQTLPVCMVHLFCNALNFLVEQCGTSVVLCTATQPLLNGVDKKLGSMFYTSDNEILSDIPSVFKTFHRVEIVDRLKPGGYAKEEISALILEEQQSFGTCLAVVNTTRVARDIYILVKESFQNTVHLSANMCPAHRMEVLENVREHLKRVPQKPLICVSTQVIEAGVDVDFGAGIRCLAGVDSIAQTTGRCNRHGNREYGRISIVNLRDENIDKLADIAKGQEVTRSVLRAIQNDPSLAGTDLLSPEVIERYFRHYFYDRAEEMSYNVKKPRNDTLLNMLAENIYAVNEHNKLKPKFFPFLRQSFASAAEQFKAIDAPTRGVIVPYKEGKSIIAQLCGQIFDPSKIAALLHRAQLYSVNVYANVFDILQKQGVIYEITVDSDRTDLGVWALRGEYYSVDFGLSREPVAKFEVAQA